MTTVSKTITVNTQGEFENLAELADITFTSGKTYTIQIYNLGYLKLADAVFTIDNNCPFTYTAGSDNLYIKNGYYPCTVAILENLEQ